jgi:hypothetical protein
MDSTPEIAKEKEEREDLCKGQKESKQRNRKGSSSNKKDPGMFSWRFWACFVAEKEGDTKDRH